MNFQPKPGMPGLPKRRMRTKGGLGAAVLLIVTLLVAACSATPASSPGSSTPPQATPAASVAMESPASDTPVVGNGKKQLGFAIGLNDLPIITQLKKHMTARAAESGWEVLYDSGTQGAIQPMLTSMQAWITAGVPAITALPFEPSAFEPLAKQAVDKGLIFLNYAVETPTKHGVIGFGPCDSAKLLAPAVADWINKNDPKAEVLITSNTANPNVKCKWEGLKKDIEDLTDATVVVVQDGNNTVDALKVTQSALQGHPNISVGIGTNDDAAIGIAQAFKAAGKDPAKSFVAGFDAAQANLEEIKAGDGFIKATAGANIKDIANLVVDKSIELAMIGQPSGPAAHFDVPTYLLMNGDPLVDEFLASYN